MLRTIIVMFSLILLFKRTNSAPYWGGYNADEKDGEWERQQIPSTNFLLNWILQLLYRSDFYTLVNYNANRKVWNVNATPNKESTPSKQSSQADTGLQSSHLEDDLVMVRDKENVQSKPTTKSPPLTIIRDYDEKTSTAPSTQKISGVDIPIIILTGSSAEKIQDGPTSSPPTLVTVRDYNNDRNTNTPSAPAATVDGKSAFSSVNPSTSGKLPTIPIISISQTFTADTGHTKDSSKENVKSENLEVTDSTSSLNMVRFTEEQTTKHTNNDNLQVVRDRDENKTGRHTTPALVVVRDKVADDTASAEVPKDAFVLIPKVTINSEVTTTKTTSTETTSTAGNSGLSVLGPQDIMTMIG